MRRLRSVESLERASSLDKTVRRVRRVVSRLGEGRLGDVLHGVWLGHPAHPALVQLPLGAWLSSGVLDALPGTERASRRLIAVGLAASLPAVATGAADWSLQNQRQMRVGLVHALANSTAVALYGASLIARSAGWVRPGKCLSYAGLAAVGVAGYLGGHVAYRQVGGPSRAEGIIRLFPKSWRTACSVADLPDKTLTRQSVDGFDVLVVRSGETVHALLNTCSHLAGPLAAGELTEERPKPGAPSVLCVVCPLHSSTFQLHDGEVVRGPATAPQPTLETRVVEGQVEVRASR